MIAPRRPVLIRPLATLACLALVGSATPADGDSSPRRDLADAAFAGDLPAVQALLRAGADPDQRNRSGSTALMQAATAGHLPVVEALVASKADVNAGNTEGWSALLNAVMQNHVEVTRALLAAGADPDPAPATYGGGRTPLMIALSGGQIELAQVLLDAGANVNATTSYGATPIRFAVWGSTPEHVRMIQALAAAGADVDAGHASSYRLKTGPCVTLVDTAPCVTNLRSAEGTALGDIAANRRAGNDAMMRALIASGANVDARQPGWRTPLMLAATTGNLSGVRLLLESGADAGLKDSNDQTARMLALANGYLDVAMLLQAAEASAR